MRVRDSTTLAPVFSRAVGGHAAVSPGSERRGTVGASVSVRQCHWVSVCVRRSVTNVPGRQGAFSGTVSEYVLLCVGEWAFVGVAVSAQWVSARLRGVWHCTGVGDSVGPCCPLSVCFFSGLSV